RSYGDWSSDVCSSDLVRVGPEHVDRESDRCAAFEKRAVAVTALSLIEVEVVGEGQGAERRRGRVERGQRELDRRAGRVSHRGQEIGRASCRERVWIAV